MILVSCFSDSLLGKCDLLRLEKSLMSELKLQGEMAETGFGFLNCPSGDYYHSPKREEDGESKRNNKRDNNLQQLQLQLQLPYEQVKEQQFRGWRLLRGAQRNGSSASIEAIELKSLVRLSSTTTRLGPSYFNLANAQASCSCSCPSSSSMSLGSRNAQIMDNDKESEQLNIKISEQQPIEWSDNRDLNNRGQVQIVRPFDDDNENDNDNDIVSRRHLQASNQIVNNIMEKDDEIFKKRKMIMISYCRSQAKDYAIRLKKILNQLDERIDIYLDLDEIHCGFDWHDSLNEAVLSCDLFVPLITENYGKTLWTSRELKLADQFGKPIVPINFDQTWPPESLAIQLATKQFISWKKKEKCSSYKLFNGEMKGANWSRRDIERVASEVHASLARFYAPAQFNCIQYDCWTSVRCVSFTKGTLDTRSKYSLDSPSLDTFRVKKVSLRRVRRKQQQQQLQLHIDTSNKNDADADDDDDDQGKGKEKEDNCLAINDNTSSCSLVPVSTLNQLNSISSEFNNEKDITSDSMCNDYSSVPHKRVSRLRNILRRILGLKFEFDRKKRKRIERERVE